MGRHRAEDWFRAGVPAAGHLAFAAPEHGDHAAGRCRGICGLCAARLAGSRLCDPRPDAPVRQVVAISSFALGMAGQVAYHLMAQAGMTRAPWAVTYSCLACRSWSSAWGPRWHIAARRRRSCRTAPDSGTGPPITVRRLFWSPQGRERRRLYATGDGWATNPRSGTRMAKSSGHRAVLVSLDRVPGRSATRSIRPASSPTGLPRRGSPCHGERCATAE